MLKGLAISHWFSRVSSYQLETYLGICIFESANSGGSLANVASTSFAFLFIAGLFYIREWSGLWRVLSQNEQLLLIGFILYAFSGMISYYNVNDDYEFIKHMGRYIRFLLIVPVYLILTKGDMKLFKYLLAGVIASGPLYLVFSLISISEQPGHPASWNYHWITFGDAAMLNAVFMLAMLFLWKTNTMIKVILLVSIVCALYASVLSQARGAWLALPVCVSFLVYLLVKSDRIKMKLIFPLLLLIVVATSLTPVGDMMGDRISAATQEVELFVSGEKVNSSIGGRLAMWHIAVDVWKQHPIIGTGLGDFDGEIELRQERGMYETIQVFASVHNIYLQALSTTGVIGFLVLCFALFIQPLRIFYRQFYEHVTLAKLGGMMVIVAFAIFGLTESWILRAPVISVYLIYLITLSATASRESVIKDSGRDDGLWRVN